MTNSEAVPLDQALRIKDSPVFHEAAPMIFVFRESATNGQRVKYPRFQPVDPFQEHISVFEEEL